MELFEGKESLLAGDLGTGHARNLGRAPAGRLWRLLHNTATINDEIFGLRPHIIGNIPSLAEDRQKRPKVGSALDALLGGLGYDDCRSQRRLGNWPHH